MSSNFNYPLPPANLRMNSASEREDEVYLRNASTLVDAVHTALQIDVLSRHKRSAESLNDMSILDLGCGTARFLHGLLASDIKPKKYVGVDIQKKQIKWCHSNLSGKGNFHFQHLNVQNDRYNPKGKDTISGKLSKAHDPFDFIMVRSVFTHMRTVEAFKTLGEIRAVSAPGARIYLTVNVENTSVPWTDKPDGRADGQNLLKVQFNKNYFENMIEENGLRIAAFYERIEHQCVYILRPA